jgi:hypothetical protein
MYEWRENSNGNYVYVIDTDDVMTVFNRNGQWVGVHDNHFTEQEYDSPEEAMTIMEEAVLNGRTGLLAYSKPRPTGWRKTKTGGYFYEGKGRTMSVKLGRGGKWYLVMGQTLVAGRWFDSAEDAKREGDQRMLCWIS